MIRRGVIVVVALALAAPLAPAFGQDAYTIKVKSSAKGSTTREQRSSVEVEASKVVDNDGKVLEDKKKTTTLSSIFEQTILEQAAAKKRPTAVKRTYEKATATVDGDAKQLAYQGKTVLIEKKEGKYRFAYDGGVALTPEEAFWLDKEFNKETDDDDFDFEALLLPKKAVKVGESWAISMAEITKQLEKDAKIKVDADKCSGKGKLLKVFMQDGRQFGVWEFKVDFALKEVQGVKFEPGAFQVLEGTYTGCIDGSVESNRTQLAMKIVGSVRVPADNPQATVTMNMTKTGEESVTELKKK